MKSKKIIAALLFVLLLAGSFAGLAGCKDKETTNPPPVSDNVNDPVTPPDDGYTGIAEKDAQAMVLERLPDGCKAEAKGAHEENGQSYFLFAVSDPDGKEVGTVAIDQESGERYNYDGEKISEYADFPLYDAATDAACDWNGVFKNGDMSIELMQQDNNQFDFSFSDGTQGFARIKGNTAVSTDDKLTFTYEDENTLLVGGENAALAGTYGKDK